MKKYTSAPLPFQGQKRRWVKVIRDVANSQPEGTTFVDVFGGSGLVSHVIKAERPDLHVVYNDYDGYSERLGHVAETNALVEELRQVAQGLPEEKIIRGTKREEVLEVLRKWNERGYVDWLTISGALLFSLNHCRNMEEFEKCCLYNNVPKTAYCADGYLDGLEIVRNGWRELVEQYKGREDVVLVLDPPYMLTDKTGYENESYWGFGECMDVVDACVGSKYMYFTSSRSGIEAMVEYICRRFAQCSLFEGAERRVVHVRGRSINYDDILYVKAV